MKRLRRHDRVPLMADVALQPGEKRPRRFAARVFNISRGGLAVFSRYYFPPGILVTMELTIPVPGEGLRGVTLYGVTRWTRVQPDGDILGIEILSDSKAGDYAWFDKHFDACVRTHCPARYRPEEPQAEDRPPAMATEDP
jgi:hypothetical protein